MYSGLRVHSPAAAQRSHWAATDAMASVMSSARIAEL
jgi:hypothetical protein